MDRIIKMTVSIDYAELIPTLVKIFGKSGARPKGKNDFLTSANTLLDWDSIEKILKSNLKRDFNSIRQPPYSELLLFKILLLQTWFNLSDTKVEEAINDRISFIKFLNLSIESDTPDHSTISRFRNSSIKDNLDKKLFLEGNRQLESKGILVKNGAIVDATIISSSRRPKKIDDLVSEARKEEDTQETISETKIITSYSDDKEGYILGGVVTGANESDTRHLESI